MLPYHGSRDNVSGRALKLFKPHILGISAGNGAQFDHPHATLIENYTEFYKRQEYGQQNVKYFWKNFQIIRPFYYLSYKEKSARLRQLTTDQLPIFGTNISGTILVQEDGFKSQFSNLFIYKKKFYDVTFAHSVSPIIESEDKLVLKEKSYMKDNEYTEKDIYFSDEKDLLIKIDITYNDTTISQYYAAKMVGNYDE